MGEVYRATDTKLDREVAIKVLPAAFVEDHERLARFEREAKLLAQLHHPNIASIFGIEESEGTRALVMELVEGPTLAERLEEGPLPIDESLSLARQIADALEEAHEKGIIHRDLKPQNIKASREGKVKVLDFGLAKAMDPTVGAPGAASASQLAASPTLTLGATQMGVVLGTAAYMAPEQAKGLAVDKRADIWAFGVVLYEALAGRRLFEGETVPETLAGVLKTEIDLDTLPTGVPPAIRRLLRRCLERSPRNRLHDIADARLVLADVAGGVDDRGSEASASPERSPWRERAAWALVAILAASAGALWLRGGATPHATPRTIRSVLELPPGVSIELDGERSGMPALSHDGRKIAFGAREGAGAMRIWVRDLASGETQALAGTEGGYRPFWSPDDTRIGFFVWGHLVVVAANGGPITRLAPARDSRGGSWTTDGTILYTPYSAGPVMAVAESGGTPRPVSAMSEADPDGTDRFPQFFPDGEHFLYLSRPRSLGNRSGTGVALGKLGALEPVRRLVEGQTNAVYADRHLLFVRDGALVAQPFDPDSFELTGRPTVLAKDLLFNDRFSFGVFTAADRDVVAFLTGTQSDLSRLVWRDRSGARLGELGEPANLSGYGGIALSPDGRWAAVSVVSESGTDADLWLFDLEKGTETRLVRAVTDEYDPVFAASSHRLYYGSRGSEGSIVLERDLVAGTEREVAANKGRKHLAPTSVIADGEAIICDLRPLDLSTDIVLVRPGRGGELEALRDTEADDLSGQLSPDGRWLAWSSDESGRYEVYVDRFPATGAAVQISRSGGKQPRWNPRGGELFFKTPDNVLTAVPVDTAAATISVGAPVPLFAITDFYGWTYDVAADGNRFLVREPVVESAATRITLLTDWTALLPKQ